MVRENWILSLYFMSLLNFFRHLKAIVFASHCNSGWSIKVIIWKVKGQGSMPLLKPSVYLMKWTSMVLDPMLLLLLQYPLMDQDMTDLAFWPCAPFQQKKKHIAHGSFCHSFILNQYLTANRHISLFRWGVLGRSQEVVQLVSLMRFFWS